MERIGFWIVKCFAYVNSITPFGLLYLKADFYSFLMYHMVRYRRKVVRENLLKSFPEKPLQEIKRIERRFYRNFCDVALETCKVLHLTPEALRERVKVANPEVMEQLERQGRSVIMALYHSSNWEWFVNLMGKLVPQRAYVVYKKMENERFDRLVHQLRTNHSDNGHMMIEDKKAKVELAELNDGRSAVLMLGDQSPQGSEKDSWTPFLHRDTCWYRGIGHLAKSHGYAVVFVELDRTARGHYSVTLKPICEDPATMQEDQILEQYVRYVERFIQDHPDNWLWSHRRWKHSRQNEAR